MSQNTMWNVWTPKTIAVVSFRCPKTGQASITAHGRAQAPFSIGVRLLSADSLANECWLVSEVLLSATVVRVINPSQLEPNDPSVRREVQPLSMSVLAVGMHQPEDINKR